MDDGATTGLSHAMPRFIVHAGAHKTGTTAYQAWLQAHHAALAQAGYIVPAKLSAPDINHRLLIEALAGVRRANRPEPKDIAEALDRLLRDRPSHDVIISSEYLARAEGRILVPVLARAIARYGYEPHAILLVRDQGPMLCSWFMQERKVMRTTGNFAHFVDDCITQKLCDWSLLADMFEREGFTFHALAYDRDARSAGSVATINALPLFDRGALPAGRPDAHNESLGVLGGIVTDIVREAAETDGIRLVQAIRLWLQQIISGRALLLDDRSFNGLTPEIAARIETAYAQSNGTFARRHLDRPWRDIFAAPTVPDRPSPETLADLSPADARRVLRLADRIIARARAANWFADRR